MRRALFGPTRPASGDRATDLTAADSGRRVRGLMVAHPPSPWVESLRDARWKALSGEQGVCELLVASDGRVLSANERAGALYGYDVAALCGTHLDALCDPSSGGRLPDLLAAAAPGSRGRITAVHRRRDGGTFPVEVECWSVEIDGTGCVYCRVRERSPAEAQAAELDLRATLASMAEGVVVFDAEGRIESCNGAAERVLGLSRQEMEGRLAVDPRWRAIDADGQPMACGLGPTAVTLRTGEPQVGVIMGVHRPDDSLRWLLVATQPLADESTGQRRGVVATFSDITEWHENQRSVEGLRARLAFALEGAGDGVWDWDVQSGRVEFSARWAAMAGYAVDELEPHVQAWERLVHPEDLARVRPVLEAHLAGDTPAYESEFRMRHKAGHWLWILDRGKVVARDAEGRPVRAVGTHTDITARRRAEETLREAGLANERLVVELRAAAQNIKSLKGFIPICVFCKKIRDDRGDWERLEAYLMAHTDAMLSHGLCPDCRDREYGESEP